MTAMFDYFQGYIGLVIAAIVMVLGLGGVAVKVFFDRRRHKPEPSSRLASFVDQSALSGFDARPPTDQQ
ncbi:hypothetical protein [Paraburkholderia sp. BCC1886]|uniref:hypothetical protein n=1 Tax=Paraburkholderia sp. BCC1886 TaxID=2562670 RepID=UPI00118449B4|nr:hypothetical protein [Paraburkholderia sp. BCC1886]